MRLLIATPLYPPELGGPATYTKVLEEGLAQFGIEVEVLKFSDVRHLDSGIRHLVFAWRVWKASWRADAIYALDAVSVGFPSMLAARLAFKPLYVKIVGDFAWEQGRQRYGLKHSLDEFVRTRKIPLPLRPFRFVQTLVARSARHIIVPSHYLEAIVAAWGVHRQSIAVVWNAVELGNLGRAPQSITELPPPRIISVGRLVSWKGFGDLIDAVQLLRNKKVYASVALVGEGPEREVLEAKAAHVLRQGYTLTGALSHDETLSAMHACDIFVLDSAYEGLSHTLIEALALSMPVIASAIGGNREVIEHEKNGLLVPYGNVPDLAVAIEKLLTDGGLRQRLQTKATEARQIFSRDAMLQKTSALLLSSVKRG
jgi:glycosyltransferase involved in cell wall biosynthesis